MRKANFVMDGLESGIYNFAFSKDGYGSGILYNVEVKKNKITRASANRLILATDQGTQVLVKGSVFNQDGVSYTASRSRLKESSRRRLDEKSRFRLHQPSGRIYFSFSARRGEISRHRFGERHLGKQGSQRQRTRRFTGWR